MNSCLYRGEIRHRRFRPREHEFTYPLFLLYLDLDELAHLLPDSWLWGSSRFSPIRFARERYLGDAQVSLKHEVSRFLQEQDPSASPPKSVRLLTHPSYLGYGFNPISFYYCYSGNLPRPEHVVAEVTNTPWGEQHAYLLYRANQQRQTRAWRSFCTRKEMHVSPFMPMQQDYRWVLGDPGSRLMAHLQLSDDQGVLFDATLRTQREVLTAASLRRNFFRLPLLTWQVILAIHLEALRLWAKRVPFHDHPDPAKRKFEVFTT